MINIILFILILLLPVYSEAAYNIYLKNGSVITGVSSYEKRGGEILINYGGGTIGILEADILKIEETEAPEKDFRVKEIPEKEAVRAAPAEEPAIAEKRARANELRANLETLNAELKTVEENESRIIASINEKRATRGRYNIYQQRLLDRQIEPLQEELTTIQKRKTDLLQRRALIEGELRALE